MGVLWLQIHKHSVHSIVTIINIKSCNFILQIFYAATAYVLTATIFLEAPKVHTNTTSLKITISARTMFSVYKDGL